MWAWFLATPIGRYCAIGVAIAAALGLAALKLIATGRQQERSRQQANDLTAIRNRNTSDEKVDGLGPDELDRRINEWVRDAKR